MCITPYVRALKGYYNPDGFIRAQSTYIIINNTRRVHWLLGAVVEY